MLKIVSHIIISSLFLISTTGLTINLHYSHNELYDIGLYTEAESCCGDLTQHNSCCAKEKQKNQCEDKTIEMKVKDDFNFTSSNCEIEPLSFINLFLFSSTLFDLSNIQDNDEIIPFIDISPTDPLKILSLLQSYLL
ncbi:hypothetical protein ACFLQ5_01645 [Bacteroidota bacterium]